MVIREFFKTRNDGAELYRHYSDRGLKIRKIGTDEIYDEAIDIADIGYVYEETESQIDAEATEADYQAALREMGVSV